MAASQECCRRLLPWDARLLRATLTLPLPPVAPHMQMGQDHELNMLLHLAASDTMELEASLRGHQQRVAQLLGLQLLPCGTAAADASQAAVGQQQHEVAAVMKLPLLDLTEPMSILTPQAKPGEGSGFITLPRCTNWG